MPQMCAPRIYPHSLIHKLVAAMPRPPSATAPRMRPFTGLRQIPLFFLILTLGVFFVSLLLSLAFYLWLIRRRTELTDLKSPFPVLPQRFSFSALRRATDSFSASKLLGQGGFGSVYRGVLESGQEIAVKVMNEGSVEGEREFRNELSVASSIDTVFCPHIVRLLGSSSHNRKQRKKRKIAIVYEHMHNGSLQDALFERKCPELMNWDKRFAIITSVAKGLFYLHNCCIPPVIHGDIKPSNILLDRDFEAKIADFGLAQILTGSEEDKTEINRSRVENKESCFLQKESSVSEEKWKQENVNVDEIGKVKETDKYKGLNAQKQSSSSKKPREWWKEEFCDELSRKKNDESLKDNNEECKRKSWSRGRRSIDRWLESKRKSSQEEADGNECTTSIATARGTVCYIAPEFSCGGPATDKCDVYNFGVLVLVVVSGRRPLQVTGGLGSAAMSEFEKANLISWSKQLASNGRLLNLTDPQIELLKRDEAVLCLTIALLCLQRSPEKRPTMKEIVGMLGGKSEPPQLPLEFSPSPPPGFPFTHRHHP